MTAISSQRCDYSTPKCAQNHYEPRWRLPDEKEQEGRDGKREVTAALMPASAERAVLRRLNYSQNGNAPMTRRKEGRKIATWS